MKGFSSLRHFERETDNDYEGGHVNFDLKLNDNLRHRIRHYEARIQVQDEPGTAPLATKRRTRRSPSSVSPPSDLGRVYDFGDGLDRAGRFADGRSSRRTSTQFREIIGFDCNCVNKYGDWTLGISVEPRQPVRGQRIRHQLLRADQFRLTTSSVTGLFGNFGVRDADTRVTVGWATRRASAADRTAAARGRAQLQRQPAVVQRRLSSSPTTMLLRGGWSKVMARPQLDEPGADHQRSHARQSSALDDRAIGDARQSGAVAVPRRRTTTCRASGTSRKAACCRSRCSRRTCPTSRRPFRRPATLQEILPPDQYAATLETLTPTQVAWVAGGGSGGGPASTAFASSRTRPAATIEGYELSYQQDFTFLPGFWKNFGVQANYTHLTSELQYIVDPGNTLVTPTTPLRPQVTPPGRSPARRRTRRTSRCTTRRRSGARALPTRTVRRT